MYLKHLFVLAALLWDGNSFVSKIDQVHIIKYDIKCIEFGFNENCLILTVVESWIHPVNTYNASKLKAYISVFKQNYQIAKTSRQKCVKLKKNLLDIHFCSDRCLGQKTSTEVSKFPLCFSTLCISLYYISFMDITSNIGLMYMHTL